MCHIEHAPGGVPLSEAILPYLPTAQNAGAAFLFGSVAARARLSLAQTIVAVGWALYLSVSCRTAAAVLFAYAVATAITLVAAEKIAAHFVQTHEVWTGHRWVSPESRGYCYLALFRRDRWAGLAHVLGRNPRARSVLAARPDHMVRAVSGNWCLAHVESVVNVRGKDPVLAELSRRGTRIGGARVDCSEGCGWVHDRLEEAVVRVATACGCGGALTVRPRTQVACLAGCSWDHECLEDAETRLQEPCGHGLPLLIVDADTSIIMCECQLIYEIQGSGPSESTGACSCGRLLGFGDHLYPESVTVLRRGARWASRPAGNLVFGRQGRLTTQHKLPPVTPEIVEVNGMRGMRNGEMWRPDLTERGLRNPAFKTLHHLDPVVAESCRSSDVVDSRSREVWKMATAYFRRAVANLPAGAFVALTACTSPSDAALVAPSEAVKGATHGLMFVSHVDAREYHPGWRFVMLPLEEGEGRYLANVRPVAAFAGRSDVDFAIINALPGHDTSHLDDLRRAGLAYACTIQQYSPCNMGATVVSGCAYRADRKEAEGSFSKYGDVYGWDETFFAVRCPSVCFINMWDAPFTPQIAGVTFERVNVLQLVDGRVTANFYEIFGEEQARAVHKWEYVPGPPMPYPLVNKGWASLEWAESQVRAQCRREGIEFLSDDSARRLARAGGRSYQADQKVVGDCHENIPGAIWRRYEAASGLRDRLNTTTTQSLNPDLWAHALQTTLERSEHVALEAILTSTLPLIKAWSEKAPSGIIGVASVSSRAAADEIKAARGFLFSSWIWLSEAAGESTPSEMWITLPRLYGSGNVFQLSRLLPAAAGANRVYSLINDIETDLMPRELRLQAGLLALESCDIAFPAMHINAPCPFQDATFRGTALTSQAASLTRAIARWGWVYGFDEVWAGAHQLPTVMPLGRTGWGGAATHGMANPVPAQLWQVTSTGVTKHLMAGGRFRALAKPELGLITSIRLSWRERAKRAFGFGARAPAQYREYEPEQWEEGGRFSYETVRLRTRTLLFVTWGTYGDRVPIVAAAKWLHKHLKIDVFVRHGVSEALGKNYLAMCERDDALSFTPELYAMAWDVAGIPGNVIAPDYLCWSQGRLPYSLRPGDADAYAPGGGLPPALDWLVSVFYWKARARVRVGLYRGSIWFPRSADGENFLHMAPLRKPNGLKRGVCIGSSSLPVPEEYRDWERVPNGRHDLIGQEYDEIVTDGGAGKVQTFRAAGVPRIRSTNNKIDRKYKDPNDCGRNCTGNEPDEKWALAAGYFYPSLIRHYAGVNPVRWARALLWRINPPAVASRLWTILFFVYTFRNTHVMPTVESTILSTMSFYVHAPIKRAALTFVLTHALRAWKEAVGWSWFRIAYEAMSLVGVGMFHPLTSSLISCGISAKTALTCAMAVSMVPTKALGSMRINARFSHMAPGIYLIGTLVWVKFLPVGLHVAYYEPLSHSCWEGVHRAGGPATKLGVPFYFKKRELIAPKPLFAIKSALTPADLEANVATPRPYSAIWNCQTMLLGLYLQHTKALLSAEALLLILGSAWAGVGILLLAGGVFVASTVSMTIAFALTPIDRAFPELHWREKVDAVRDALSVSLVWWGDEDTSPPTEEELRDTAAQIAADAIRVGISQDTVFNAIAEAVVTASYDSDPSGEPSEVLVRSLFEERRGPLSQADNAFATWVNNLWHSLARATHLPTRVVEGFAAYVGSLLEWSETLTIETVAALACAMDWLEERGVPTFANVLADGLSDRLGRATDSQTRRKNVWAILSKRRLEKLRRADWLALSLKPLELVDAGNNPAGWMARMLNKHHADGGLQEEYLYRYPSWLPRQPRASAMEFEFPSLLHEADAQIDPELTERVSKYLTLGGSVGLDGMWAATDEAREAVTSRYFSEPNPMTDEARESANEIAEALYALHPEAFEDPGVVLPETVKQRLNKKGRTGVPLMQLVKSRRALERTGWMQAIISATYECLETGVYPPDAFTEFAKMMVLPAEKMVTKGPRTIMATSLLTNFVNNVYELERRTRKTWPTTDTGIGAPLTAAYMGKVFERIAARETTFSADMTAFDANIPPVIYEVLARLGELGSTKLPVVGLNLRRKYHRLQNSHIYDLPSGKVWKKARGGATGETATSWDNTWAMRAIMISLWAEVTGKPMTSFYETNTVHNTGDDNVWGTDDNIDPATLSALARDIYGLDLRVEASGDVSSLSYLSKIPVPAHLFSDEIMRVMDHVPEWTVVHDVGRLLSRRGAVISHASGRPFREYKRHLTERNIGHALLCAHQRDLYNMLAHEYMEDARRYVGARNYALVYDVSRDAAGHIEAIAPRFTAGYIPTPEQASRLKEMRAGALKWPSYQRVLEAAYKDKEVPPLSEYATARVAPTLESVIREKLFNARVSFHEMLPEALVKLAPMPTSAPFSPIFVSYGYPVEKFVWRNMPVETELAEFASELRQAPWSVTTDSNGFWWYLTARGKEEVRKESMLVVRGRMVVTTAIYAVLTEVIHWVRASRLGLLMEAWQIYTQDAPRLFALLDSLHWLETSKSSPVISSLTPKDPYATQKKIAVTIGTMVPDFVAASVGWIPTVGAFASIAELIARIRIARIGANVDLALKTPHANRWGGLMDEIWSKISEHGELSIGAPTSTGKSTEFPAEILKRIDGRVWLVVHTKYLRDTYGNPWVSAQNVVKLSAGVTDHQERLAVLTYGHICARRSANQGPAPGDVVLFDEFHERKPIQGVASHLLAGEGTRIYMSATPSAFYLDREVPYFSVPIEREFAEVIPTRLDLPPMETWAEAKRSGADVSRVLFCLPSIDAVAATTQALLSADEAATAVHAARRVMPKTGHIVGTAVVDAGINVVPPATCLIDAGLQVCQHKGRVRTQESTPSRLTQRLGRVGRMAAATAWIHPRAGTGPEPLEYPTALELIAAEGCREWLLGKLGIRDRLVRWHPSLASRVDPRMSIRGGAEMVRDRRDALNAWWLLSLCFASPRKASEAYDAVRVSGWPEQLDSVANLLGKLKWLPPRHLIQSDIDERVFQVLDEDDVIHSVSTIAIVDDEVRWR